MLAKMRLNKNHHLDECCREEEVECKITIEQILMFINSPEIPDFPLIKMWKILHLRSSFSKLDF